MNEGGIPEYVANSWNAKNPMLVWEFGKKYGKPTMTKSVISNSGDGHGQGFGDVNGDGHE